MNRFSVGILIALATMPKAYAQLQDVEAAQQKSKLNFMRRFNDFKQDKNVMGGPTDLFGNSIQAKVKVRENNDDKIQFESDLTQHDFEYDEDDQATLQKIEQLRKAGKNDEADKVPLLTLYAGTSHHGSIQKGGGSSEIERVSYQQMKQFETAKTDPQKDAELAKKGIVYQGWLKKETIEVPVGKGGGAAKRNGGNDKQEVSRYTTRDEARPAFEKVGTDSFQSINQSAKDPDKKNDPQEMGNLAFYYDAAKSALGALWDRTTSKLGQRRIYDALGQERTKVVNEDGPDCEALAQNIIQSANPNNKQAVQDAQQQAKEAKQQCQQVAQTTYKQIAPKFEQGPGSTTSGAPASGAPSGGTPGGGGGGPQLTFKGPQDEDARERDYRVELNVLAKVGTRAGQVPSNWKYKDQDEKSPVTTAFDSNGQPTQTENLRMDEQVDRYNGQLDQSAAKVADVRNRFPGLILKEQDILNNKIQKGQKSAMEIVALKPQNYTPGFEPDLAKAKSLNKLPESYSQLLQQGAIQ